MPCGTIAGPKHRGKSSARPRYPWEQPRSTGSFLRVPALSLGLYRHAPGAEVPQQPHTEDEVYYVIAGPGKIEIARGDHAVEAGAVVYVPIPER
jgi:mannose-6-phosphate isomerase-like protein (cupin superfamily)